jgi:hypothetical protein
MNSPTPTHVPEPELENEVDVDASPSRQNSAHSMTSASTAPSQVLETPSDQAQEQAQEQSKLPETKSTTSIAKASNHVDERAADVVAKPVSKPKSRDGYSHVSRDSQSSHRHEQRHEKEMEKREDVSPPPEASKDDKIVQILVKRGEKSRTASTSEQASATTANADLPTASMQPTPEPSAAPAPQRSKAPPSAARMFLPMHIHSRRRQASSPISKGEVEAARALAVAIYYPLEKHIANLELLEELLLYLSFQEFAAFSSTSKRIRTMLEDRKELRETVLERFLGTVGYMTWEFGNKEPLELTLKVCVHPSPPRMSLTRKTCPLSVFFPPAGPQFLPPRRVHPGPPLR